MGPQELPELGGSRLAALLRLAGAHLHEGKGRRSRVLGYGDP